MGTESILKPATTTADAAPVTQPMIRLPRVLPQLTERIDLGEQVVGSHEWFDVFLPRVADGFVGTALVVGSLDRVSSRMPRTDEPVQFRDAVDEMERAAFSLEAGPGGAPLLLDTRAMRSVRVGFAPRNPGRYDAMIQLALHWSDGSVTEHAVRVTGRARLLTEVTGSLKTSGPAPIEAEPREVSDREAHPADGPEFATLTSQARDSAAGLADMQGNGVETAERESDSFRGTVPQAAWWAVLAEIAITMGVAGIAGVVAKSLAQRLASRAVPDAADATKTRLFTGLADGIKDGLKSAGKQTIPMPGRAGKAPSDPRPESQQAYSSNAKIDFWARQRDLLQRVNMTNRKLVTDTAAGLAREPEAVQRFAMGALAESLEVARLAHAARHQTFASETQWVAGLAQTSLGQVDVEVAGEDRPRSTTDLQYVRADNPFVVRNGLLQLTLDQRDGQPLRIAEASLRGVSQEIADQLWTRPLLGVPIPILIKVTRDAGDLTITRDEAGRIRAEGSGAEPTLIRGATALLEEVLGRSLQEWQLPMIQTNDATGRGN